MVLHVIKISAFFFSLLGRTCTFLRETHSAGKWGEGHVPESESGSPPGTGEMGLREGPRGA